MSEFLSPGVYNEEVPNQVGTTDGVSTSAMGIAGYWKRGPIKATLVGTPDEATRIFGKVLKSTFAGLALAGFFANGGLRAYVARTCPADALVAGASIEVTREARDTGEVPDGVLTTFSAFDTASGLEGTVDTPIRPGSLTLKYREAGVAVVDQAARLVDDSAALVSVTAQAGYAGRIAPASLQAFDSDFFAVVPGTVTLKFAAGGANRTVAINAAGDGTLVVGADTIVAKFDHKTGIFSILTVGATVPIIADNGTAITVSFTPATATRTLTDNGLGALTGATLDGAYVTAVTSGSESIAANTVVYETGGYNFKVLVAPHNHGLILASYSLASFKLTASSPGAWGNDLRVRVRGFEDTYNAATGVYGSFTVLVDLKDEDSGLYSTVESYEDLSFSDPESDQYFLDVINGLSDYVVADTIGSDVDPSQLNGRAGSKVLWSGNGLAGNKTVTGNLSSAIVPRTLTITYTDSTGVVRTITDNGDGLLLGAIDGAQAATINYVSGAVAFTTVAAIKPGTTVLASFARVPQTTLVQSVFGDTTRTFTLSGVTYFRSGTEGTFDATNWGRNRLTNPAVQADKVGIYALDGVEEILQIVVPDLAGDVTATKDILAYVAARATQPQGGDRFAIIATPRGMSAQKAKDWFRYELAEFSDFAALYWPWVVVADPYIAKRTITLPPVGQIAGIYARTDSTRNVGKTPAGTVDGALKGVLSLERDVTQADLDIVYPAKINPLRSGIRTGLCVWGGRTISNDSRWKDINARRLFMFLEQSIFDSTFWAVFENVGAGLSSKLQTQVSQFMLNLHNEGYFAGNTPKDSFSVVNNSTNNSTATQNAGQSITDIAAAPNKPGEFIRFRFARKAIGAV